MPYSPPSVFVSVDLSAASVTVPSPELMPLIIGEHYFVLKSAFAGFVQAGESTSLLYPKLPSSYNVPSKKLSVDVSSIFAPQVEMVLGNGVRVDITSKLSFTSSAIVKTPITETYDGVPYSGSLYVTYRALSDQYSGVMQELLEAESTDDLVAYFGADGISPANPLAYGMYQAMRHAGIKVAGLSVGDLPDKNGVASYTGVVSDPTLSYAAALDFSKSYDLHMPLPMTSDDYVLDTVLAHVKSMSSTHQQERRLIFAPSMNDFWPIRGDEDHTIWHSVIADDSSAKAYLNGGYDPSVTKNITDTADSNGLVLATCEDHGLETGASIDVAGLTDIEDGTVTVTVVSDDTFTIDDSVFETENDTGTFTSSESAIGTEFEPASGGRIRRIAAGDGTEFGTFITDAITLSDDGSMLDTLSTDIDDENVTIDFYDGDDRRMWVELSSSALENPSTRLRVGDRMHVFGTTFTSPFMATITYPGVASDDTMVEVVAGSVSYDHFDVAYSKQIRFYREATAKAVVDAMSDMAKAYGTERLLLLAPDIVSIDGVDVPSFYVAAQLGADMCLVGRKPAGAEPGAYPFTGVRNSINSVWKSSRYFTDSQLNTAAEGGITWLVNDFVGGPVTTRDTISTDPSTVETRDFILGVERDFLAKAYRKALRPDIRKFRVDQALISRIGLRAAAIASKYTDTKSPFRTFQSITIQNVMPDPDDPTAVILIIEATHLYVLKNIKSTLRIVL